MHTFIILRIASGSYVLHSKVRELTGEARLKVVLQVAGAMYSTLWVGDDSENNSRSQDRDSVKAPKFLSLVTGEIDPKKDGGDEPVEALDLRMSKMDECVSMYGDANLLSEPHGGLPSAAGPAATAADANRRRREERAPYNAAASRFSGVRTPESRDYYKAAKDPQYLAKHLHTPDPKLPSLAPPSPNSLTEAAAAKSRSIFQPLHEHNHRQQQHPSHRAHHHHHPHHPNSAVAHPTSPPPLTHLPKSSPSHLPLAANPRHSLFRSSLQNGASKPRSYWRSHYAEQDDEGIGHEEVGNGNGELKIKEEPPPSPLPQQHRQSYFNSRHHVPQQPYNSKGYNSHDEDEHLVLQYPPQSSFRQGSQQRPPPPAQTYLQRRSCSPEEPRAHPPPPPTHHQLLQQQHQAHQRQMLNHHHQQQQQQQHRRGENGYSPLGQVPPHFPPSKHNPFANRGGGAVHPSMRAAMGAGGDEGHLGGFLQQVLRRPPAAAPPYLPRTFHHHQQLMQQQQQQQRQSHRPLSSLDSHLWALEQSRAHWGLPSSLSPPPNGLTSPPASPWRDDGRDSVNTVSSTGVGSGGSGGGGAKGRRGRPRKHAVKIPLPPLYVFIRNLLHSRAYNPRVISWVSDSQGIFKVTDTQEFARTWGLMKANRSEEMNYEKMSRAMRYHYGSEKQGRKGHLGMVREKRLVYRFGELAVNWRRGEVRHVPCQLHQLCKGSLCLWTKE